jgi:CheY-like chemotaxis protein
MPKGGQICIAARNAPGALDGADAVAIAITDEGSGMTAEQIDKAFEPFFTTKGVGRGTGLGLSQVYGFTRAAEGTVTIDSAPGRGTTVSLVLPRCHRAPEQDAGKRAAAPQARQPGWRILLVEDDDALAELIGEMLAELGCSVARAPSADEALSGFDRTSVDAVISDMVMPGSRNGLDLARAIRDRCPDLPVLLMTGYSAAASSATDEGFDVIAKPFTLADLAMRLGAFSALRRRDRQ